MSEQASPDSKWVFVEETIPDNTKYKGGTLFHKRWRIRNTGPATWDSTYKVTFVAGEIMDGPQEIGLAHDVAPNQEIDIVFFLKTPEQAGTYRGDWHIEDAEGRIVQSNTGGGNFWVKVESTGANDVDVIQQPDENAPRQLIPAQLPAWQLGINMRDFAYFDIRGIHSAKHLADYQKRHVEALRQIGVTTVRFYGCHMHFDANQCIDRIGAALNQLSAYGLNAVVSLNDTLGHSQLYVQGDDQYHSEPPEGYLHKDYFNQKKYYENYMPHIEKVTSAFSTHNSVLVWELGNEYVTKPVGAEEKDLNGFLEFARDASDLVARTTSHRISLGLLNSHQISQQGIEGVKAYARKLYGLPNIDLITVHYYNQDGERHWADVDAGIAKELGKPYYIGEMGTSRDFGERTGFYRNDIQYWKDDGAFMVMPWGFSLDNQPYLDNRSIIDNHHDDFNAVIDTLKQAT